MYIFQCYFLWEKRKQFSSQGSMLVEKTDCCMKRWGSWLAASWPKHRSSKSRTEKNDMFLNMTSTPLYLLLWCLDKNDQHIPWKMVAVKNDHDSHGIESVSKSKIHVMKIWSQPPDWRILRVCLTGSTVNLTPYLQSGQKKTGIYK